MSDTRTLIAYATRGGTTEDYAKAISSVLTDEFEMQTDLVNLKQNRKPNVTAYQNIIIGMGIKIFRMHKEGAEFLEKTDFGERKVVIFLSSLEPRDEAIKKYVDGIIRKNPTLKPLSVEVFGGRMKILGRTLADKTDIEQSKAWIRKIIEQLKN